MQIIGGASKLLSFFIKTCSPINIVSYADKRYSNGNLYKILGFNLVEEIKPDYKYIDTTKKAFMLERKEQFWHRNMSKRLAKYDPTKSEKENTQLNKIYRIYDCGKLKFVWFPTTP
jgi:type II restriction/modification system DNA methylase subunit YeeA